MFFELRLYRTWPGQRENWVRFMEDEIIPFQIAQGMVIEGRFVCQEEDDLYVWIRRFNNEDQRNELYKAVYESDFWCHEISPRIPEMLDRSKIVVHRLEGTLASFVQ